MGANQTIHVSTFMVDQVGSHSLSIGGNRDLKVGGDHKRTVTGASTLTIGGMQIDLVAGSVDENGPRRRWTTTSAPPWSSSPRRTAPSPSRGAAPRTPGAAKVIVSGGGRERDDRRRPQARRSRGAILTKIKEDRVGLERRPTTLEIAGGAQLVKAVNVVVRGRHACSAW